MVSKCRHDLDQTPREERGGQGKQQERHLPMNIFFRSTNIQSPSCLKPKNNDLLRILAEEITATAGVASPTPGGNREAQPGTKPGDLGTSQLKLKLYIVLI